MWSSTNHRELRIRKAAGLEAAVLDGRTDQTHALERAMFPSTTAVPPQGQHRDVSDRLCPAHLHPHSGRYRCERCRRTTIRQGPTGLCMAWRCGGRLAWENEPQDDFELRVVDGNYAMLRVAEHSAQVPNDRRERIENQFKGACSSRPIAAPCSRR